MNKNSLSVYTFNHQVKFRIYAVPYNSSYNTYNHFDRIIRILVLQVFYRYTRINVQQGELQNIPNNKNMLVFLLLFLMKFAVNQRFHIGIVWQYQRITSVKATTFHAADSKELSIQKPRTSKVHNGCEIRLHYTPAQTPKRKARASELISIRVRINNFGSMWMDSLLFRNSNFGLICNRYMIDMKICAK